MFHGEKAYKMKITEHIHGLRLPFTLTLGPGKTVERMVYSYIVFGETICLIDCGVSSSGQTISEYIKTEEHAPGDISLIVLTHAHPDHMGSALAIQRATGCRIAAHSAAINWIEDVSLQFSQRPVPSFHSIVDGSVNVDIVLKDEELITEPGCTMKIIHARVHQVPNRVYPADTQAHC